MQDLLSLAFRAIFVENMALSFFLGMCIRPPAQRTLRVAASRSGRAG